jgi:hypothetical protein
VGEKDNGRCPSRPNPRDRVRPDARVARSAFLKISSRSGETREKPSCRRAERNSSECNPPATVCVSCSGTPSEPITAGASFRQKRSTSHRCMGTDGALSLRSCFAICLKTRDRTVTLVPGSEKLQLGRLVGEYPPSEHPPRHRFYYIESAGRGPMSRPASRPAFHETLPAPGPCGIPPSSR